MRRLGYLIVGAVAVLHGLSTQANAQAKFPMDETSGEHKEGSTTVNSWGKLSKQSDKGLIEAKLWVRKSGISGVGYGMAQFILLDKDGNTIWKSPEVSEQVGAVVLKGTAEKEKKQDIDVPLDKLSNTAKVLVVAGVRDTDAFSNDELKAAVNELIGSAKDELKKNGMALFKKVISL